MKKITVIGSVLSAMLMLSSCSTFRDMSDNLSRSETVTERRDRNNRPNDESFARSMSEDHNYTRKTDDNTGVGYNQEGDSTQSSDGTDGTVGATRNARVYGDSDQNTMNNRRNRNRRTSGETQRNAYNNNRMNQDNRNGQNQYNGNDNSQYNTNSRQNDRYDDRNYSNYNGNNSRNQEYSDNYNNGFSSNQVMRPEVNSNRNMRENAEYRRNNFQNNGQNRTGNTNNNNQYSRNPANNQVNPGDPQVMYDYRYGNDTQGRYQNQQQPYDNRYGYREPRSNPNQMNSQGTYNNQGNRSSMMGDNYPNPYQNENRNPYANENRNDMDRLGDLVSYEIDYIENRMKDIAEKAKDSSKRDREQMEKQLRDLEKDRMELYRAHRKVYQDGRNDMESVDREVRDTLNRIRTGQESKKQ